MSCSRHYGLQLSECMDGRLPSRKREKLLEHVASCPQCARTLNDLRRAQSVALQAQSEKVSASFRADLHARIASGEGTPEFALARPVPLATKARYVAAGAAAAALMLFTSQMVFDHFFFGEDRAASTMVATNGSSNRSTDISTTESKPDDREAISRSYGGQPLRPRSMTGSQNWPVAPVDDQAVLPVSARLLEPYGVVDSLRSELRTRAASLSVRAQRLQDLDLKDKENDLHDLIREVTAGAMTFQWMAQKGFVDLPEPMARQVDRVVGIHRRGVEEALREIRLLDVEDLTQRPSITCCQDQEAFQAKLLEHFVGNPFGARLLNLHSNFGTGMSRVWVRLEFR